MDTGEYLRPIDVEIPYEIVAVSDLTESSRSDDGQPKRLQPTANKPQERLPYDITPINHYMDLCASCTSRVPGYAALPKPQTSSHITRWFGNLMPKR